MKKSINIIFLLLLFLTISVTAQSQSRSVSGLVVDEKGEAIIGASVSVPGSKLSTVTDLTGYFKLNNIPVAQQKIQVSYLGYLAQAVDIKGKQDLKVIMQPNNLQLNDVVVVGYGAQKRAHLTGAISTINPEDIKDLSGPSLSMSLRGLVPGVNVSGNDSRPGSTSRINIRQSSLFGTATSGFVPYTGPLYVIDGFIADDESAFNNLDPDMIEGISVLKDASAAVYGSRAANGVIIVTTKKGKLGAPKISYSAQLGYTDEISRIKLMDAYNYGVMYNTIYTADPTRVYDNQTDIFQADELEHMKSLNYNLLDKYWTPALTQRHSVNVTGATEKVNYYAGISYYTQDGNIGRLTYDRWNYRSGMDAKIGKGLTASLQVSGNYGNKESAYSKVGASGGQDESDYQYLYNHPTYIPEYVNGLPIASYGPANSGGNNELYHFDVLQNLNNFNKSRVQEMTINGSLAYDFGWIKYLKGLKMELTYSKDISTSEGNQYATNYDLYKFYTRGGSGHHLYTTSDMNVSNSNLIKTTVTNGNMLRRTMDRGDSYQLNYMATYSRSFGLHNISGLFTIEKSEREYEDLSGQVLNPYPFTNYQSNGAPNPENVGDISTSFSRTEGGTLSYAGRANYSYANKYILEFLIRTDASTKFAPENYWGTFPSGSAGWIISQENWYKGKMANIFDYLKVRGSFGLTGRDNINAWQWLMTYDFNNDKGPIFGTSAGTSSGAHISVPDAVPNRDAHWDKSYKSNFGIDANALKGKLGIVSDIYYEWNRDVFMTRQGSADYPSTVGAQASAENYGSIDDWGIELSLTWRDKIGKDFKYNVGINTGYGDSRTLIKPWPAQFAFNDLKPKQWANTQGGWGYECIGMFRNYQEIEEYFAKYNIKNYCGLTKENVHPGMLIYNNIRGSQKSDGSYYGPNDPDDPKAGYVDGNDLVKINNRSNTWGFTMNAGAEWKGLSVKFQIAANWGDYTFMPSNAMPGSITNGYTNYPAFWENNIFVYKDIKDAQGNIVVHQNLDAKYPNMAFNLNSYTSTFWKMNGLDLTLRDVTLAYSLPNSVARYFGIESARINITGQNMLTLYNPYPDHFYDPMSGSIGNYPNLRRITAGINVSF